MTAIEPKAKRFGTVLLKVSVTPVRYERFAVHEYDDGQVLYYLGAVARTSDGWVTLAEKHHDQVSWQD